jgi:hypothetical protein
MDEPTRGVDVGAKLGISGTCGAITGLLLPPYIYPFVAGVLIFLAIYLDSLKNLRRSVGFD